MKCWMTRQSRRPRDRCASRYVYCDALVLLTSGFDLSDGGDRDTERHFGDRIVPAEDVSGVQTRRGSLSRWPSRTGQRQLGTIAVVEVAIGGVLSVLTGIGLWMLLPRGVVLTKQHPVTHPYTGEILPDTWRITNSSALPILVTKITESGVQTFGHELKIRWRDRITGWVRRRPPSRDLPVGFGGSLTFDDHVLETRRSDRDVPTWTRQIVPPGESLTAHLMNNASVRIVYRRAGWSGWFERRELMLFGYG